MLEKTRLTYFKIKRYAVVPRLSTFGALLFLSTAAAIADEAPAVLRQNVAQTSPPLASPSSNGDTQVVPQQDVKQSQQNKKDLVSELTQLEFRFQETQKIGSERLDELMSQITELRAASLRIIAQVKSDAELTKRAQSLVSQLDEFQSFIDASSVFFNRLAELDVASLDAKSTRSFFASLSSPPQKNATLTPYYNEVSVSSDLPLATYRAELLRAAASLDALETLESWNAFVETNGLPLERFYVGPDAAENALEFITQTQTSQGLPKEFQILKRRASEWRFTSLNRVAIQRKILLALESELTVKYWTFAASRDKIYYLQHPPRSGRNVCFADSKGALGFVDVPENAPETATSKPTQRLFLQSLAAEARSIPESLRVDDAARWYAAWSALLSRLQTTDALDPLVKFRLLYTVAQTLSTGDYYFAQRLEPTLRMLNVPRLSGVDALDVFQAENLTSQELRSLARTRIAFLPTDRLTVDKTTEQLDAQVERFAFVYRRVGWLDRDFSGAWRCRRPQDAPLPIGDLYVLLLEQDDVTNAKTTRSEFSTHFNDAASSRFRWLKIGSSDGRQISLKFAARNVCRGSIILCRSRVGSTTPVAEHRELERLLRR